MSNNDIGGYVYPVATDSEVYEYGISRRDWLAGLAMQGIVMRVSDIINFDDQVFISKEAYKFADAMIAESNK